MKKIIFAILTLSMTSAFCEPKGALCKDAAVNLAKAVASVEEIEGSIRTDLSEMNHGGDDAGKLGSEKWRISIDSTTTVDGESFEHGDIYDVELNFSDDLKCKLSSITRAVAG
jgi:hypothetical protein